jgi:hypothetical protein
MKLIKVINQHRRDFQGEYQCEFCNHIEQDKGMSSYDDHNYHANVILNMKCKSCGCSTLTGDGTPEPVITKYPEWYQI